LDPSIRVSPLQHLYTGSDIIHEDHIAGHLSRWQEFISFEKSPHIAAEAAKLMAEGQVIGWFQGKSEFGPRALGNRSILADPRPAENKDIINEMVKKREHYRPFAPSILEEYAGQYYVTPDHKKQFPYMIFVLDVKEEVQKILGAVTHVDGTARIQTVSQKTNPKYWELIDEFRKITGIPIVLNTSFNNNVEPIVDSVDDAVVCILTTQLNTLAVGDYLVRKKEMNWHKFLDVKLSMPAHLVLNCSANDYWISNTYNENMRVDISADVYHVLSSLEAGKKLLDLLPGQDILVSDNDIDNTDKKKKVVEEIIKLWGLRQVCIYP
jgi:carbamoyltransferase